MFSTDEIFKIIKHENRDLAISLTTGFETSKTRKLDSLIGKQFQISNKQSRKVLDIIKKRYPSSYKRTPFSKDKRKFQFNLKNTTVSKYYYEITHNSVSIFYIDWDVLERVYIIQNKNGLSSDEYFNTIITNDIHDVVLESNVLKIRNLIQSKKSPGDYTIDHRTEKMKKYRSLRLNRIRNLKRKKKKEKILKRSRKMCYT